jgi:hypothetical protein
MAGEKHRNLINNAIPYYEKKGFYVIKEDKQ